MLIALIGPDGSGKTSVAHGIIASSENLGFNSSQLFECNFHILPTFSEIRDKILKNDSTVQQNSMEKNQYLSGMNAPSPIIKASIIFFWYTLDYALGRFSTRAANKEKKILIFGRYYHDFFFQRVNRNLPNILIKALEHLIPKPDLLIFLKRDPSAIFSQKPELTVEEIELENNIIVKEFSKRDNFHIIDAEQGLDNTISSVISTIKEHTNTYSINQ